MRTVSHGHSQRKTSFSIHASFLPLLHRLIIEGRTVSAKLLIESGEIDVSEPEPTHKNTPLHFAAAFGREKIARILIEAGADLRIKNDHGMTPIDYAKKCNHLRIAEIIQKHLPQ